MDDLFKKEEEAVNNPKHYGGKDNPYETIKVIEAWELGFFLGNTVKYISRAGKKDKSKVLEDLEKAKFYLEREIDKMAKKQREVLTPEMKEKQLKEFAEALGFIVDIKDLPKDREL